MGCVTPASGRSWEDLVAQFDPADVTLLIGEEVVGLVGGAERVEAYFRTAPPHDGMRRDTATWCWASSVAAARAILDSSRYTFSKHPEVELPGALSWSEDPFSSRSWQFNLHSLRPVEQLLGAYVETSEPAFLERAKELIESWIDHNVTLPPPSDLSWHDHATAKRLTQMVLFWQHRDRVTWNRPFLIKLLSSIHLHAEILSLESFYTHQHNHGLCQGVSLMQTAVAFPEFVRSGAWRDTGLRRFRDEIRSAFTEEGVHRENSPLYHRYVLRWIKAAESLDEPGRASPVDPNLHRLLDRAYRYILHVALPNGEFPLFGDSDTNQLAAWYPDSANPRGRPFAVPEWVADREEIVYVLTRGRAGKRPSDAAAIACYPESGYAFFRSGWPAEEDYEDAIHLSFKAQCLSRAHRHADLLSFCLYGFGERWIVDSGPYGQGKDNPFRRYMRSALAHNVVLFGDGFAQGRPDMLDRVQSGIDACGTMGEDAYVRASCNYPEIGRHEREIFFLDRNSVLIRDTVEGFAPETRSYELLFHIEPSKLVAFDGRSYVVDSSSRQDVQLAIVPQGFASLETRVIREQTDPVIQGFTGFDAATLTPAPVLVLGARGQSFTFETALFFRSPGDSSDPRTKLADLRERAEAMGDVAWAAPVEVDGGDHYDPKGSGPPESTRS